MSGGTVPFLAGRWSLLNLHPMMRERAAKGVMHYLGRFFYDTLVSANPHALSSLLELVGPSQVLFGSDDPFATPLTAARVRGLASFDGFDAPKRAAIERDNALALLSGFRARLERA
ncbi:MAG TPA: amidohydrolase family protein [Myxococcota bacterium]|nr:amidohydrolase family protein [Myxococcota bacterium]